MQIMGLKHMAQSLHAALKDIMCSPQRLTVALQLVYFPNQAHTPNLIWNSCGKYI